MDKSLEIQEKEKSERDEDKILDYVKKHGSISNTECRTLLSVDETRAYYLLNKLSKTNKLKSKGEGKGRRYLIP